MLYHLHELNRTLFNPLVAWSGAAAHALSSPDNWLSRVPGMDRIAAGYELMYRLGKAYEKPEFDIHTVHAHEHDVAIVEQVAMSPMRLVAIASAASDVIGSSQLKGVLSTSFQRPRTSARKIESKHPASAFCAISTV